MKSEGEKKKRGEKGEFQAEVKRLNNLFEKYLSRPLMLRYLPSNRF